MKYAFLILAIFIAPMHITVVPNRWKGHDTTIDWHCDEAPRIIIRSAINCFNDTCYEVNIANNSDLDHVIRLSARYQETIKYYAVDYIVNNDPEKFFFNKYTPYEPHKLMAFFLFVSAVFFTILWKQGKLDGKPERTA